MRAAALDPAAQEAAGVDVVSYMLSVRDAEDAAGGAAQRSAAARAAELQLLLGQPYAAATSASRGGLAGVGMGREEFTLRAVAHARCGALPLAAHDLMRAGVVDGFSPDSAAAAARALVGADAPPELLLNHAEGWHAARRQAILARHPELKRLIGPSRATPAVLAALLLLHLFVALRVVSAWTWPLYAATVGATCAYAFQALTHEIWHQHHNLHPATDAVVIAASSVCNFPWRWYYSIHHPRHHADTGGNQDFDGIVLFRNWHSPPLGFDATPFRRWLWTTVYGHAIFFLVAYTKAKLGAPLLWDLTEYGIPARAKSEGTHVLAYFLAWLCGGWPAIAYMWWAAAFSLGAAGHPYMGFWIIQHQCAARRQGALFQPSVSYYGSGVWRLLNFEELLHVEHHDFPRIPWTRVRKVRRCAPEFYAGLDSETSVVAAVWSWILSGGAAWMDAKGDFAGQNAFWANRGAVDGTAYDLLADRCHELGVAVPWAADDSDSDDSGGAEDSVPQEQPAGQERDPPVPEPFM